MKMKMFLLLAFLTGNLIHAQNTSDMLENVLPSVVTVAVYKSDATKQILGFRGGDTDIAYEFALDLEGAQGSGSGFIIEKNGKKYIITNAHVVEDASDEKGSIYVYTIDRSKYEARIVGGDSFYDIAVLEFVDPPGNEISVLRIRLTEPRIGEQVYAIGNPLGEYPYTVSDGIISAKNRVRGGATGKFGFLQTTATVIWGNSGGPLVDSNGELVGINSQIAFAESGDENIWQPQINFALEAPLSNRLIDEIIANEGRVKRAFIGIELSQTWVKQYNVKTRTSEFVLRDEYPVISGVMRASPAFSILTDKIGYQVKKINDVEIRSVEEALGEFEKLKPGDNLKLTLLNNDQESEVNIKTQELTPERNEQLGKYVVENDKRYSLSFVNNKAMIIFNEETQQKPREKNALQDAISGKDRVGKTGETTDVNDNSYFVVSVGLSENNYNALWKVESLGDIGAAIRLSGMYGFFDIICVDSHNSKARPQKVRINLSNNSKEERKVLWY